MSKKYTKQLNNWKFAHALLVISLTFLISCSSNDDIDSHCVFHYNQVNPISSLDPAFAKSQNNIWAVNHLYDGLLQLDNDLGFIPCIAKSWVVSDSGQLYTFELHKDVFFHSDPCFGQYKTRKVVASDIKYSLERIISEQVNSPGSWIFSGLISGPEAFTAVNDSVFEVRLNKPFLPFLGLLTMEYCSIIPHEAVEYYGSEFRSHPVGTGPFKFKRWIESQGLFLLTNKDYYAGANTSIEGIRTSFITDRNIAYLELMRGNIDFISGVESSVINELLNADGTLKEDKKDQIKLYKSPYLNTEYLGINMDLTNKSFRSSKAFRQGLNYAVDKVQMMATLRNNAGTPALSGFVPLGLPSYDAQKVVGYAYDLAKAKERITASGYFDSEEPELIEIYTNKDYLDITTYVAKQWERLGINVEIKLMESAVLRDGMRKSKISIFRASWIADYPDAENYLSMFYSKNPAPPNYTRFKNETFDVLYEQSLGESNDSLRYDLYQQMDRIIVEEAPVIFLFYDVTTKFVRNNISGISDNGLNLLKATDITKDCE